MSDDETPVTATNLIKGYEKGEAFKPGEVKSSEKPDISEPVAKNLISSFESGKVYTKVGDVASEKPDIHEPLAKNLISSFEKGDVSKPTDIKHEKPVSRPGATKNLQKVYEGIDAESKADSMPMSPSSVKAPSTDEAKALTSPVEDAAKAAQAQAPVQQVDDVKESKAKEPGEDTAKAAVAKQQKDDTVETTPAEVSVDDVAKVAPAAAPTTETKQGEKETRKTALVVFAHWKRKASFNGALLDVTESTLRDLGYNVIVSDLYAMGWNPTVSFNDLGGKSNKRKLLSSVCTC